MGNDIDVHLGKRLRRRRRLLGLTQQQLAGTVGVRFQQIQKYECGANRISASRLWQLSEALEVPVGYFYDGLSDADRRELQSESAGEGGEMFARKETLDLIGPLADNVPVVLVVQIDLNIRQQSVQGHIIFLLSVSSLQALLQNLDKFLAGQGIA